MPVGYSKDNTTPLSSGPQSRVRSHTISYKGYISKDGSNFVLFRTLIQNDNGGLFSISSSGHIRLTALTTINIVASCGGSPFSAAGSSGPRVYNSSNSLISPTPSSYNGVGLPNSSPIEYKMSAGDYIVCFSDSTLYDNDAAFFSITATEIVDSIQNFVVNIPPASAETNYFIEAAGNAGQTVTANVTDIPFILTSQNNLTWNGTAFIPPIDGEYEISGSCYFTTSSTYNIRAYVNGVDTRNLSVANVTTNVMQFGGKIKLLQGQSLTFRSSITGTLVNNSVFSYVSITRLNGRQDKTYIGNVPAHKIAFVERYTDSYQTLSTSASTLILDTLTGDNGFVSLASNQFTLQSGEYLVEIETHATHGTVGGNVSGLTQVGLWDVTLGSYTKKSNTVYCNATTADASVTSGHVHSIRLRLSLSASRAYELRAARTGTVGVIGIGQEASVLGAGGSAPVQVKITKLS